MPNQFFLQSTVVFTSVALTLGISAASHIGTAAFGLYSCGGNLDTKQSAISFGA